MCTLKKILFSMALSGGVAILQGAAVTDPISIRGIDQKLAFTIGEGSDLPIQFDGSLISNKLLLVQSRDVNQHVVNRMYQRSIMLRWWAEQMIKSGVDTPNDYQLHDPVNNDVVLKVVPIFWDAENNDLLAIDCHSADWDTRVKIAVLQSVTTPFRIQAKTLASYIEGLDHRLIVKIRDFFREHDLQDYLKNSGAVVELRDFDRLLRLGQEYRALTRMVNNYTRAKKLLMHLNAHAQTSNELNMFEADPFVGEATEPKKKTQKSWCSIL